VHGVRHNGLPEIHAGCRRVHCCLRPAMTISPPAASPSPHQQAGRHRCRNKPAGRPVGAQPVANAAPPAAQYEPPPAGTTIAGEYVTSPRRDAYAQYTGLKSTSSTRVSIATAAGCGHPEFFLCLVNRGATWLATGSGRPLGSRTDDLRLVLGIGRTFCLGGLPFWPLGI